MSGLPVRLSLAAVVAAVVALACVSERQAATAPPSGSGECRIDIGGGAVGTTVVAIRDFTFQPAVLRVPVGSTVTWVNCEPEGVAPHTSTADGGAWSSPLLASGEVFTRTFDTAGEFPYHCVPHPQMVATVIVE